MRIPIIGKKGSEIMKTVNNENVIEEVMKINPIKFVTSEQPDNIYVHGVNFERFDTTDFFTYNCEHRYVSSYQATIPTSNGIYPYFEVVVESKTKTRKGKKSVTYDYVFGWDGTGMK